MKVPVPDEILPADRLGRVHFVGIGGAGLSGIARIMLARGIAVSGSDARPSRAIEALRALGADVHVGHAAEQVADGALTSEWVAATVPGLVTDTERLRQMSEAATALIPRDADDKLARIVVDTAGKGSR